MNKIWFILRAKISDLNFAINPLCKKSIVKNMLEEEYKNSKKHRYATFEQFLRDCPEYQIDGGLLGSIIRRIMAANGAKFQQWVFIDEGSPEDKTVWIRREKDLIIHEKGTFFTPWLSGKKVEYRDIHDSRPLIDRTHEMDWQNPDMCADVVTAVTNSRNMNDLRGLLDPQKNYMLYTLILSGLTLALVAYMWYNNSVIDGKMIDLLTKIAEQTAQNAKVIPVK